MEITGELFIDVAGFRRMARAEFGWVQRICGVSLAAFFGAVLVAVHDSPLVWAIAILALLVMPTVATPVQRLTRVYAHAGPIAWHYRIDEHGFRVTGRRTVTGSWARYRKVVETEDLWLVRPPFTIHRVALPKAAFAEEDRRVVAALVHGGAATVAA